MSESHIEGTRVITQDEVKKSRTTFVTILPGSQRPGFSVIESTGVRDDDMMYDDSFNHSTEEVVAIREDEATALELVAHLTKTRGYSNLRYGYGEETYHDEWRSYKVGNVTLQLCMVDEIEINEAGTTTPRSSIVHQPVQPTLGERS